MSKVLDNFLNYVKIHTTSDEDSLTCPSTEIQFDLANELAKQCKQIGMTEVNVDENAYVTASIMPNCDIKTIIGFMSHMDTSPAVTGKNVNPQIVEYKGGDIVLNSDVVLSPNEFPSLNDYIGKTIITTDGNTLLGADDKAGIAEIMTAAEYIINNPDIKHGKIRIAFTPDEEIGRGADKFDVKKFNADFAYTVDGGKIGELEYENFNAAKARIFIHGKNVHPGTAKNIMVNSILIASELIDMLPKNETPAHTQGYEGFYHLDSIEGNVEQTKLDYIIRDFDMDLFNKRKEFIINVVNELNQKYGKDTITLDLKDQYFNMVEKLNDKKYILDLAIKAMKEVGIEPIIQPIRGGTDGSRLSFMGLPCPNIFTGGHNFHGKYEYIPIYAMEKAVEVIVKIVELSASL